MENTGAAVSCREVEMETHLCRAGEAPSFWCVFPSSSPPCHSTQLLDRSSAPLPERQQLPSRVRPSGHGSPGSLEQVNGNGACDSYSALDKLRCSPAPWANGQPVLLLLTRRGRRVSWALPPPRVPAAVPWPLASA